MYNITNSTTSNNKGYDANCVIVFNFILWTVLYSIICLPGVTGNLLSFLVFLKGKRNSANILLKALLLSGTGLNILVIFVDSIPYGCEFTKKCNQWWYTWPYIRYIWIFTPILHMTTVWIAILIAVNKYYAVCRPFNVKFVWTKRRTNLFVIYVCSFVILFNLPRFFEYKVIKEANGKLKEIRTSFGDSVIYQKGYKIYCNVLFFTFGPLLIMSILTARILWILNQKRMNDVQTHFQTLTEEGKKRILKPSNEITVVLLITVITTILCQVPIAFFHLLRSRKRNCADFVYFLDHIAKFLVNVNAAFSFVIYTTFSKNFRKVLINLLTCKKPVNPPRTETTTFT